MEKNMLQLLKQLGEKALYGCKLLWLLKASLEPILKLEGAHIVFTTCFSHVPSTVKANNLALKSLIKHI